MRQVMAERLDMLPVHKQIGFFSEKPARQAGQLWIAARTG